MSKINKQTIRIIKRSIIGLITVGVITTLIVISLIVSQVNSTVKDSEEFHFALILGSGLNGGEISERLKIRLDTAFDYLKDKQIPIIVSGGQGEDELITEAEAMKSYLSKKGIAQERLILEDRSTSTYENLLFSKEIAEFNNNTIVLITSDYHMYRAKRMGKRLGIKLEGISAKNSSIERVFLIPREILAVIKELILPNE